MRYKWRDIPTLLRSPIGRWQFANGVYYRAFPLLSRLAILHRQTFLSNTSMVAVVGSFGKTTTARALASVLIGKIRSNIEHNAWSHVAGSVLGIRPFHHHGVIEVGIERPCEMAQYARMIHPNMTIVTSIGSEHNRSLKTLEVTRAEKSEMIRILPASGVAVLNGDDPNVRWMESQTKARVVTFGLDQKDDIWASDVTLDWPRGTWFRLHAAGETRDLHVRLVGRIMVYPILAAVAAALSEGLSLDQILPRLETLPPTPGRLEPIQLSNGVMILRDDYKSSLETIEVALDLFSQIGTQRRIVVLGDVSEPPGSQGPIYRHIGERIAKIASRAFFVGGGFQPYASGAVREGLSRDLLMNAGRSVLKAVEAIQSVLCPGDAVLIKGRNTQRLDRITLALSGRKVRCDIRYCDVIPRCQHCPMLERGWKGLRVVI
jgi:UDP-N-acetylmuramoyl-tripeptide--D-alanyl-D-alanine ligase